MKLNYRDGNWPSFFGYAQYYRRRWKPLERKDVQLLEVLALLRHCQNDLVEKFVAEYKKTSTKQPGTLDQILSLSRTRFKGKEAQNHLESKIEKHFEGTSMWPILHKNISKVNPKNLKIEVANLCSF